jgi:hypothetical protein
LRRAYHYLIFDGPGQGGACAALRPQAVMLSRRQLHPQRLSVKSAMSKLSAQDGTAVMIAIK